MFILLKAFALAQTPFLRLMMSKGRQTNARKKRRQAATLQIKKAASSRRAPNN
jgi:hypothetical protein